MEEINTEKTLAGGMDVVPADGGKADAPEVSSLHEVLSQALGKPFKDDESALKAVKDTFSYVGEYGKVRPVLKELETKFGPDYITKMDEIFKPEAKVDESKFVSRDEFDSSLFYSKHPEYEAHKEVISALRSSTGKPLNEVVELPSFKTMFEKVQKADESEKSQSVLKTNPRIGQATDKISQAQEAAKSGNSSAAAKAATDAVMEAFDLK